MRVNGNIDPLLFSGNANRELAQNIATHLHIQLGDAEVSTFSDGEISITIRQNVRAREVFIVQPTCSPSNNNLMEILLLADALRRASAESISAVIPYFGYARQDRRPRSARVPVSAKVVANMLQMCGLRRIITMDLHADQVQGFFDIPVDNIYASPALLEDFRNHYQGRPDDLVVISPDVGGVVRARALAKQLGCNLAIIDKRRPSANVAEVMNIIGEIVDRTCVIMDDMVDTAGTLCAATNLLKERGAKKVFAYCTHPVLSGEAIANIQASPLDELVVSDTIPLSEQAKSCQKIRQITVAPLFAETIHRVVKGESVLQLFSESLNS